MADNQKIALPFEPNLDSLSRWLTCLPINSERERYTLLFSGLQALDAAGLEPAFQFKALERIRAPVFQATAYLTSLFLGKPLPLDPGIRKLAKLSVQFQVELAQGYYALAQAKGFARIFSVEEQGRIVHCALRSYNQTLLRLALMYEAPSSSTWLRVNDIYRLAERGNLSRWTGRCSELAYSAPCSVEELYLRMLAFRLLDPRCLGQDEIQLVFDAVQRQGRLLLLSHNPFEEGRKADFSVDLDSAAMPSSLSWEEGRARGDLLYVFARSLRRMFGALGSPALNQDSGFSARLSAYLQIRLGGSLAVLPDKKSISATAIVGYKSLVDAMTDPEAAFNLQDLEDHILPFSKLDASKTSGTFSALASAKSQVPPAFAGGQAKPSGRIPCQVWPADAPGFYLVEGTGLASPAECLLGIFADDKLNQFGHVCPGRDEASPNTHGFELLASQVSLVKVFFDANPKKKYRCFFSSRGNGRFSLIAPPLRLRGGDSLAIDSHGKAERYKVAKMLERTADFCQFEIVAETAGMQSWRTPPTITSTA